QMRYLRGDKPSSTKLPFALVRGFEFAVRPAARASSDPAPAPPGVLSYTSTSQPTHASPAAVITRPRRESGLAPSRSTSPAMSLELDATCRPNRGMIAGC